MNMFIIKSHPIEDLSSDGTMYIVNKKEEEFNCAEENSVDYLVSKKQMHKPYWGVIESCIISSKANFNLENLYQVIFDKHEGISCLTDYCNLYEVLEELKKYEFSNKTFINFVRHFPILDDYIESKNYHISAETNSIRFHIWKNNINLVINFNSNYLIDFFSYDNDERAVNDKLIYSMKGTFSSSSDLRKSYKIERLLSILGEANDSRYIWEFSAYSSFKNNDASQIGNFNKTEMSLKKKLSNRVK